MKQFLVNTNFGHTYQWTSEQIAQDYAATAIQWQGDDDIEHPKTEQELYEKILKDEQHLDQWFCDYIRDDHTYAYEQAELVSVDKEAFESFIRTAIYNFGRVVYK